MTHRHLSHSVAPPPCRETCRLRENTFPPPCKQNTMMCPCAALVSLSGLPFDRFPFRARSQKICRMIPSISFFGFSLPLFPSRESNASAPGCEKETHVKLCKEMKAGWWMQCENAVTAVRAIRCDGRTVRSASQPERKANRARKSLFHNAVSQAARKSGAVPSHQWPGLPFGGACTRNVSSRKAGSRRFEAYVVLLLSNVDGRVAACAIKSSSAVSFTTVLMN